MTSVDILNMESRRCFDFFWQEVNLDQNSPGYGLIRDRAPSSPLIASIASVGFGLTAIPIGVERGWISRKQGYERALSTLKTLLYQIEQVNGFFYHFMDLRTGKRALKSEISIIDTAIAICGAITAGEYFGQGVKELAEILYRRVQWGWYRDPRSNQFYMSYTPERGFSGWWDFYAEQLIMYILGAASPTDSVEGDMFYSFVRQYNCDGHHSNFIYSWYGSLFTYQFSHAWLDMRNKLDREGVDWWKNSVAASESNHRFCVEQGEKFKGLGPFSWGLTACDGPWGYNGRYGAAPSGLYNNEHVVDGTVPPCGAAGSIVFVPQKSLSALQYYYEQYPNLWGKYGFMDAFNIDVSPNWFSRDVIGINKGITLLMIENYRTGLVWRYFMKNRYVQRGLKKVGVVEIVREPIIA